MPVVALGVGARAVGHRLGGGEGQVAGAECDHVVLNGGRRAGVTRHRQADCAFAAAFFCFLNSRTFCSEVGSTTSATERYPSSA